MVKTAYKENIVAFKVGKLCSPFSTSNTIAFSNKHTKDFRVSLFDFSLFLTHREELLNANRLRDYKLGFNKSN